MLEFNAFVNEMLKWAIPIVITGIAAFVTAKVLPPLVAFVEANTEVKTRELIGLIFAQIVRTAEATRLKATLEDFAFDALGWALAEADRQLLKIGIDLDEKAIHDLLKAELLKYLNGEPATPPAQTDGLVRARGIAPNTPAPAERFWA